MSFVYRYSVPNDRGPAPPLATPEQGRMAFTEEL